jgi:hypothetical protein
MMVRFISRTPNAQLPIPKHYQSTNSQILPISHTRLLVTTNNAPQWEFVGVGNWEWLGVGRWKLGVQKVTPALTPNVRGLPISPMNPEGASAP